LEVNVITMDNPNAVVMYDNSDIIEFNNQRRSGLCVTWMTLGRLCQNMS